MGRGFYAPSGQYRFEFKPNPGPIYDYYPDQILPADFLRQATTSYTGAANNDYGLIFRLPVGEEGDDFYTFRISGDGFYTVEKTELKICSLKVSRTVWGTAFSLEASRLGRGCANSCPYSRNGPSKCLGADNPAQRDGWLVETEHTRSQKHRLTYLQYQ
jgi:hypothetical protein